MNNLNRYFIHELIYLDFLYAKELNKTPKEDLKDLIEEVIND